MNFQSSLFTPNSDLIPTTFPQEGYTFHSSFIYLQVPKSLQYLYSLRCSAGRSPRPESLLHCRDLRCMRPQLSESDSCKRRAVQPIALNPVDLKANYSGSQRKDLETMPSSIEGVENNPLCELLTVPIFLQSLQERPTDKLLKRPLNKSQDVTALGHCESCYEQSY